VIAISPLSHNWAVRFLSDAVYDDIEQFELELASGKLRRRLKELQTAKADETKTA